MNLSACSRKREKREKKSRKLLQNLQDKGIHVVIV